MPPQGAPSWDVEVERSKAQLKARGRDLADLFRTLAPTIAAVPGSALADSPAFSQALAEAEQLMTAYLHSSQVGLGILDAEFRYLAVNPVLAEMNGIPARDHLSKSIREVLGDFAELVEAPIKRVFASGQPYLNLEVSHKLPGRPEGGHWVVHYVPIPDAMGKVTRVGGIVVEITGQKRLEEIY